MISDLDHFYLDQKEPTKSCLLALKNIILTCDNEITTSWKYSAPFFCYKGKMFCYFWINKKNNLPYIGFVEGHRLHFNELKQENRKRMKILEIFPHQDIPIILIKTIIDAALDLYRSGKITIK